MGIYVRGRKLWITYKDEHGEWISKATPYVVGQEALAQAAYEQLSARAARMRSAELGGIVTVGRYAERWLVERQALGLRSVADDASRLRHAEVLWEKPIELVRPHDIHDLVMTLRKHEGEDALAPRTIRHVYFTLNGLFKAAQADELISSNPCVMKRGLLPGKRDADLSWRTHAIFTRGEVEILISSDRLHEDRRVLYALLFLAGVRFGEAAALRWRSYDATVTPLGRLVVTESYNVKAKAITPTKSGTAREVPVHPTLASVLASWKLGGFERMLGRRPVADDLLIPSRRGACRSVNHMLKRFHEDLDALGMRRRRQHDARRTFISLSRVDGARKDLLEVVTHGPRGDIVDIYTTFPWPALCAEVAKLKIGLRAGQVVRLREEEGA